MSKHQGLKARLRAADPAARAAIIEDLPYSVGFGKPPKPTRFSSDRQPARRGRTSRRKTFGDTLIQELAKGVDVIEGGKHKRRSKEAVIAAQLVNKAVAGDNKAQKLLLDELRQHRRMDLALGSVAALDLENQPTAETKAELFDLVERLAKTEIAKRNGERP